MQELKGDMSKSFYAHAYQILKKWQWLDYLISKITLF